jgi:copper(I)-binding protein
MMRPSAAVPLVMALAVGCRPTRGGRAAAGTLEVTHAVVPAPASTEETPVFMVIANAGATSVAMVGAGSPQADSIRMHRDIGGQMQGVQQIDVPAGGRTLLVPGGFHLMLAGLRRPLAVGDTVTLELSFEPGGALTVRAPVLTYTDAVSELPVR